MSDFALNALGYLASALVVTSLTMSSVLKFRIISLIGSITFLTYGLLINSVPVALTNAVIMVINIVFLYKLLTHEETFDVVDIDPGSKFLHRYLEHNRGDIESAWPGFEYQPDDDQIRLVVFRDMVPAGIFIADVDGDTARVQLDFAGKDYRDLKNARVLFGRGRAILAGRGIRRVVSRADTDWHRGYLVKFGFEQRDGEYVFEIH